MSYDIYLTDPVTNDIIILDHPHQMNGGTYALGGTQEAWLNVTWNYGDWYRKDYAFGEEGIRAIYGLSGVQSIPVLEQAIKGLEDSPDELPEHAIKGYESQGVTGYWIPTKANAIKPLYQLLAFARMRPDGIWEGD